MVSIKVHFDGKALIPNEPLDLPRGAELLAHIEVPPEAASPGGSALDWLIEHAIDNDDLPTDLSHQHDHYLYGTPKKKE